MDLAKKIESGEIFTSQQVESESLIPIVFLPIALGVLAEAPKKYLDQIGLIYGPMSSAGPRSINGYPSLFKIHFLHKADLPPLNEMIQRMRAAQDAALLSVANKLDNKLE